MKRYIRTAARWWEHNVLYPRRRAKLMKAAGAQDTCTKFDLARRQHKPTRKLERQLKEACTAKLRSELHHG